MFIRHFGRYNKINYISILLWWNITYYYENLANYYSHYYTYCFHYMLAQKHINMQIQFVHFTHILDKEKWYIKSFCYIFNNIVEHNLYIKFGIKNKNVFVIKTKIPLFLPFHVYSCSLKNARLNTKQCWVNIGQNTCWIVFDQQLG